MVSLSKALCWRTSGSWPICSTSGFRPALFQILETPRPKRKRYWVDFFMSGNRVKGWFVAYYTTTHLGPNPFPSPPNASTRLGTPSAGGLSPKALGGCAARLGACAARVRRAHARSEFPAKFFRARYRPSATPHPQPPPRWEGAPEDSLRSSLGECPSLSPWWERKKLALPRTGVLGGGLAAACLKRLDTRVPGSRSKALTGADTVISQAACVLTFRRSPIELAQNRRFFNVASIDLTSNDVVCTARCLTSTFN